MKGVKKFFKVDYGNLDDDQIYLRKEDFLNYLLDNSIFYKELKKDVAGNREKSLNPETSLEEIRLRALLDTYNNDVNLILISYVCKFNVNLEEDFLKELAFITSNIFDFKYYNRRHINVFMDLIGCCKNNKDAIVEQFEYLKSNQAALGLDDEFLQNIYIIIKEETRKNNSIILERLNWNEIKIRNICSNKFFEKYDGLCNSYYMNTTSKYS